MGDRVAPEPPVIAPAANASVQKQGAYGKIPTHKRSKLEQFSHPLEIACALSLKLGLRGGMSAKIALPEQVSTSLREDIAFCDRSLGQVSRSFAAVIRQLPRGLVLDILIFYLVLRALDTIEDDMEAFVDEPEAKLRHLRVFGTEYLGNAAWAPLAGVGEGAEAELLQSFQAVNRVFHSLPAESQDIIRDVTNRMGAGMAQRLMVALGQGTADLAAYNEYCYAVAGLVGEGLTRLFIGRGYEGPAIAQQGQLVWPFCTPSAESSGGANYGLAVSMGLFLQKANIIRDYLEDFVEGRSFWPQSEWRRFADDLDEFAWLKPAPAHVVARDSLKTPMRRALSCVSALVADALMLVPESLRYLALLEDSKVFRFCAIPQVMAIATLEACFNNPLVFSGVVKIRKGLAARLILSAGAIGPVRHWFRHFALRIRRRCPPDDPSRERLEQAVGAILGVVCVV